jgi:hypothetical protein
LVRKIGRKRRLKGPIHIRKDDIKIHLKDMAWYGLNRSVSGQGSVEGALVNTVMNLRGSTKYCEILE